MLRRAFTEGSFVREGQLLFEIEAREYVSARDVALANVAAAEAQAARAGEDVARYEPLVAADAIAGQVYDNAVATSKAARLKGDPGDPAQACAPMPGMVTEIAVSPGQEVRAGDKLLVLEAMKMLTTVSASADGVVKDLLVKKGDQVDSDDLLLRLV